MNETMKLSEAKAHSIIQWWNMAGADYLVKNSPQNWLSIESQDAAPPLMVTHPPEIKREAAQAAPAEKGVVPADWPHDLEQLKAAIAAGADLPGNCFGGKSVTPFGIPNARLMIVLDLPSAEDVELAQLSSGNAGRLLENMIAAMELSISDCFVTALATTRPAIGEIPDEAISGLSAFMMHQIQIVKPNAVLMLGTAACKALLNAELMTARQNLHYFNHDGQKVTALTTFHPRTLLARPILKAQAWKDLQMLMKKGVL